MAQAVTACAPTYMADAGDVSPDASQPYGVCTSYEVLTSVDAAAMKCPTPSPALCLRVGCCWTGWPAGTNIAICQFNGRPPPNYAPAIGIADGWCMVPVCCTDPPVCMHADTCAPPGC
jgi:hypothetical protein